MHKYVIFNHELMPASEAKIPAVSPAALYGQGVFTTLAIYNSRPFLWKEHWKRLIGGNKDALDDESVLSSLKRLIEKNKVQTGRARITLFANKGFGMWKLDDENEKPYHFLIMTGNAHAHLNSEMNITKSVVPVDSRLPLTGRKSNNYLARLIEFQKYNDADDADYNEAISINERGHVVSGCLSNVFWIKDGELFTPKHSGVGIVEGTTRNFIIKIAKERGINVRQVRKKINALEEADEIFLTSSGIGVCLVKRFDERVFTYTKKSLAYQLREAYKEFTMNF